MKPHKPDPGEEFLERRLAARVTKTTPSLESRFERIRFQPQAEKSSERSPVWIRFPLLVPLSAAAVLSLILGHWYSGYQRPMDDLKAESTGHEVYLEDPYLWDEALAMALPALDPETLEAIHYFAYYENTP